MEFTKVLMVIAVIAVVVSVVNLVGVIDLSSTGYASDDTGTAAVNIEAAASIEFVSTLLDWGSGYVDGATFATLDTESAGGYTTGWFESTAPLLTEGLRLRNIGNVNVIVTLESSNDAAGFIGGSHDLSYQWKVSDGEVGSCGGTGPAPLSYTDVSLGASPATICPDLAWTPDTADELLIDLQFNIPDDATSGTKQSLITARATAL